MAGFDNEIAFSNGVRLEPADAQDILLMQNAATDVGVMNISGSPEGVVSANPGSIACDRSSGNVWKKQTGTGNTGWAQLGTGTISGTTTQYAVIVGAGSNQVGSVGPSATTGQLLRSNGSSANPSYSTATYPDTTTANQILYSSANNTVVGLATGNNSVLLTNGSGVPSLGNTLNGDFTYTGSTAGSSRSVIVQNTDNTNSASHAVLQSITGGTSGGDAYFSPAVGTSRAYGVGIDNASSQSFAISTATGGSNVRPGAGTKLLNLTSAGEHTLPLQPSFFAYLGTSDSNATGNGAVYTLGGGNALTESFDQGGDFNTNGTFTAPVTGIYTFQTGIMIGDTSVATQAIINLVAGGVTYRMQTFNPVAVKGSSGNVSFSGSVTVSLTASQTAVVQVTVTGEAGNTVTITGGATRVSYFSGCLVC